MWMITQLYTNWPTINPLYVLTDLIYHTVFLFIYLNSTYVNLHKEPWATALRHRANYTACTSDQTNSTHQWGVTIYWDVCTKGSAVRLAHDTGRAAAGLYS